MQLDIIIVTHNSREALEALYACLGSQLRDRLCIVDNASTDGTVAFALKHKTFAIQQTRNLGFARAANIGAKASSHHVLCFLNPDCRPSPEVFEEGLKSVEADRRCCAVPSLLEPGGQTVSGLQPGYTRLKLLADALLTNYGESRLWRHLCAHARYHNATWHWPHGACLFMARDFFLELGGFDERYFLYMEDVDFGMRLYAAGGRIVLLPAIVGHGRGNGSSISRMRRLALLNMGRIRYAAACYGIGMALILGVLALPGFLLKGLHGGRR